VTQVPPEMGILTGRLFYALGPATGVDLS